MILRFMEHHVWAVWDYFQLLKRLQREFTCVALPWRPTSDPQLRRFISEIVLEEECDLCEDGRTYQSHLEIYLRAMRQAGADVGPIERFLKGLAEIWNDCKVNAVLPGRVATLARDCGAPAAAVDHIEITVRLAVSGGLPEVAAVFTFGREDVIPAMFSQILKDQTGVVGGGGVSDNAAGRFSIFQYYLERHIELDAGDHAPLAFCLVESVCGTDYSSEQERENWARAEQAVKSAFQAREKLWDAVLKLYRP